MNDKFLGLLICHALGDSLGTPYEFTYGRLPYKDSLVEYGPFKMGQVSDDTEMMIALLQSLLTNNAWIYEDVVKSYSKWAYSNPPDIGVNTRLLFLANPSKIVQSYEANYENMKRRAVELWSQSNGCLMRSAILSIFPLSLDIWKYDCMLTNPHPTCIEACRVYQILLRNCLTNKMEIINSSWSNDESIKQTINDALMVKDFKTMVRDVSKNRGWVCHALYFAIVMYNLDNYSPLDAFRWIIRDHNDSDTDTNACIAGAVIGAKIGYTSLVQDPIIKQNIETIIRCKPDRPVDYHPIIYFERFKDIMNL